MVHGLSSRVTGELTRFARDAGVRRVVLFGSRARGTNGPRSDVDLAVSGGDFNAFYWAVTERIHSLLTFDLVDLDRGVTEALQKEIDRDGVVIYEKAE